jgi:hypothetical protein
MLSELKNCFLRDCHATVLLQLLKAGTHTGATTFSITTVSIINLIGDTQFKRNSVK